MADKNDELLKRLLATFRIEADEHIRAMSVGLAELEKNPAADSSAEIVETVYREAHSLKGAARSVNLTKITSLCQPLESVLAALKNKQITDSPPLFDLLYQTIDALAAMLAPGADTTESSQAIPKLLSKQLDDALHGKFSPSEFAQQAQTETVPEQQEQHQPATNEPVARDEPVVITPSLASETIRISTRKLNAVMRQVEELLSPRLASAQRARELREVADSFAIWKKQRTRMQPAFRQVERYVEKIVTAYARSNGQALQKYTAEENPSLDFQAKTLPRLLEYLESNHVFMETLEERLLRLSKFAAQDQRTLAGMSDSLLHDVKEMHLLPFSSLLEIYPRFTRELARDQGKQVELLIGGDEIEIDRHILEEIKDPLMHLLRNCIDHGIEQPAVRQNKGKPPHGTITIAITQKDGGKIELLVADDGAGIDAEKVKETSRRLNLVTTEEAEKLNEQETQALVFLSGISTSPIITDISGRGLGLAIVLEKIERLGGVVTLESYLDRGTAFHITLPLMLATFRGVLVRASGHDFVIPALSAERVVRVEQTEIRTVENRATVSLDGQVIALVSLGDVLELPRQGSMTNPSEQVTLIVLGSGRQRVAFQVEEILGEQEVLVKTLGRQLVRVRNIAGASVLGNGQVVAVLNVPDLLKSAAQVSAPAVYDASAASEEEAMRSIMVVEDSITSRSLLKSILESAGYRVTTAVDGMDAYTTLKTGAFDLIVSDVEMPRMDGFDLTSKVRADKQLGELPVVLVTSLESREHRERGIDVGANAYIVKSSFDQSNLLEVISRLI